jgi:hypothetical protein
VIGKSESPLRDPFDLIFGRKGTGIKNGGTVFSLTETSEASFSLDTIGKPGITRSKHSFFEGMYARTQWVESYFHDQ